MISKIIAKNYPKLKQIETLHCKRCGLLLEEDIFFIDDSFIEIKSKNCTCGEPGISIKSYRLIERINILLSKHPKKGE